MTISVEEESSFFEALVTGDLEAVESKLIENSQFANHRFLLSAISNGETSYGISHGRIPYGTSSSITCSCWQFYEVGFEIDTLAGFYPGSLGWRERIYPRTAGTVSSTDAMETDQPSPPSSVQSEQQSDDLIRAFLLSLKVKDIGPLGPIRVCRCRKEDGVKLLLDSARRCQTMGQFESLLNNPKMMNLMASTYPLHIASMLGYHRLVDKLITNGADVSNKTSACGLQPVHVAIMYRRILCLQSLVDAGADLKTFAFSSDGGANAPFDWHILPLSQAIELLLESIRESSWTRDKYVFPERKRKLEELDEWHRLVARNRDAEMIETLLRAPVSAPLNVPDGPHEEFTYPLLRGLPAGPALVERLLVDGADPNSVGWGREAALNLALTEQDLELIKLLLFFGADPNHKAENNDTLLHFLAQATISSENDVYAHMIRLLLKWGANPNIRNDYGETALMDAINVFTRNDGVPVACNLFLENDALDVMLGRTDDHYTALHSACWCNLNGVVAKLLEKGADPCCLTLDKNSPLGIAAFRQNTPAVLMLAPLNRHLIDNADKDADRAIHYAAYHGQIDMVSCLLDNGADPSVRNSYAVTPIWYSCCRGHLKVLVQLLRFQAFPLNVPSRGTEQMESGYNNVQYLYSSPHTPLYVACHRGHFEVARLLIESGYPLHDKSEQEWIIENPPEALIKDKDFRQELMESGSRPPTLATIVSNWLRGTYGRELPRVVYNLPLPVQLKKRLLHRDLPEVEQEYRIINFDEFCLPRI